ncbi:MAG: phosphotransferase [Pedobacter sp.]|jgi:Ser/Thr protein kinase RdoA (MazF antagonist)|uniref:phosphotransferase enzyme family protein n=1 Tax=Pedobacter sp. TaxID=1411316 RepID=UPI00356404DA
MDVFPAQYSTLSSKALAEFLTIKYDLKNVTCRLLIHNVSDTYLLETETINYVFKVYRDNHRKLAEIKGEVELLNLLFEGKASVAHPIKDAEGKYIQSFNAAEGVRQGVMFSYALGTVVSDMNEEQLATVGKEMAKIHNISSIIELRSSRKEYSIDTMLLNPLAIFKPAFEDLKDEYIFLTQAVNQVAEKISELNLSRFSYGYCQYDFLPKNFHFDETGHLTFFDFDFAGKGHLINDIASFYIHYFLEVYYGKMTQEKADKAFAVFVTNYRKVRSLSDEELAAIPYFGFAFWIFYLGFQYENFDDWSNIFFGPKYLKDRTTLIKKWVELHMN